MSKGSTLLQYLRLLQGKDLVEKYNFLEEEEGKEVALVSCNSKDVIKDTLFICKGAHFKEEYLKDSIKKGAICYISESYYVGIGEDCSYIIVKDIRKAMGYLANYFYDNPWENFNLIGITGTKGKSTTTYFLRSIFDEYLGRVGEPLSGVISSIDTYDGVINMESHITTPESIDLQKHFSNSVNSHIKFVEMEVSSQALKYDRVLDVEFNVGCFLNIGYDHVSDVEHKDFQDYFNSKLRLFNQCDIGVINLNSEHIEEILQAGKRCNKIITYGIDKDNADICGYDVKKVEDKIIFKVKSSNYNGEFELSIPGLFNVENALCAIAVAQIYNISYEDVYKALKEARVKGRMEVYHNKDRKVIAIVDYAHNKLSFEKLFESVKEEYPGREIVTVFGCPGKKAFDRRKDLGEISALYSNKVIITEEDHGEESLEEICNEIASHINKDKCQCSIVFDRGEAIKKAISEVKEDTIILITGKGDETRQKRGNSYIDCPSDVEYTKKYLKEYDSK